MPPRRDFELKACPICWETIPRKRFPSHLQTPSDYDAQKTCGKLKCARAMGERTKREQHQFMRQSPRRTELQQIAAENGLTAGVCSRCGADYVAPIRIGRGGHNQSRCEHCMTFGGSAVTYLRGHNRGYDEFHPARMDRAMRRHRSFTEEARWFPLDVPRNHECQCGMH